MQFKSILQQTLVLAVTLFVGISTCYAVGNQCSSVFTASNEAEALVIIKKLNLLQYDLQDFLKTQTDQNLQQKDLQEWINNIESLSEGYLSKLGVSYVKNPVVYSGKIIGGALVSEFRYSQYQIISSDRTTRVGSSLNGVLVHKKLAGLSLVYNPLLSVVRPGTAGYYHSNGNELVFGIGSLAWRSLGLSDVFRHEVQHALEDYKISQGEKTLASFRFVEGKNKDEAYGEFMSLDEVETHLRDVRFWVVTTPKFNELIRTREKAIEDQRSQAREDLSRIKKFIVVARAAFKEIDGKKSDLDLGDSKFHLGLFTKLNSVNYREMIVKIRKDSKKDFAQSNAELTTWALQRLSQIESEVLSIEKKYFQEPAGK